MKNTFTRVGQSASWRILRILTICFASLLSLGSTVAQNFTLRPDYNFAEVQGVANPSLSQDGSSCGTVYKVSMVKSWNANNVVFAIIDENGNVVPGGDIYFDSGFSVNDGGAGIKFDGNSFTDAEKNSSDFDFYVKIENATKGKRFGVYRSKPSPETFTASVSKNLNRVYSLGEDIEYTVHICSSNDDDLTDGYTVTYEWQASDDSAATWMSIPDETAPKLKRVATYDYRFTRCLVTIEKDGESPVTISSPANTYKVSEPSFEIVVSNAEKINKKEFEVLRWTQYDIDFLDPITGVLNPPGMTASIEVKSTVFGDKYKTLEDYNASAEDNLKIVSKKNGGWQTYSGDNLVYNMIVSVNVPFFNGSNDNVEINKEFLVRTIYTVDEGAETTLLFYDDFGYFSTDGYHYVDAEGNEKTQTIRSALSSQGLYWAEDLNEFVQSHKFSYTDPENPVNLEGEKKGYDWCPDKKGWRIEDGYYAITDNPSASDCGNDDYWAGTDHTGETVADKKGAMLFVNCKKEEEEEEGAPKIVVYEREFKLPEACTNSNAYVLFSAYVSNAVKRTYQREWNGTQNVDGAPSAPVNVRFDVFAKSKPADIYSCSSGDVAVRDYGESGSKWSHMTTAFPLNSSDGVYVVRITNNMNGGAGNDILLDDISVTLCYPNVELATDANETEVQNNEVYICGAERKLNLQAFNKNDIRNYIPNPVYRFQYSSDEENWTDLEVARKGDETSSEYVHQAGGSVYVKPDPKYVEIPKLEISLNRDSKFTGKTYFRVVVANSEGVIDDVVSALANKTALPTLACNVIYAIDSKLTIFFRPAGNDIRNISSCPDNEITIEADKTDRPEAVWKRFVIEKDDNGKETILETLDLRVKDEILSIEDNVVKYKVNKDLLATYHGEDYLAYIVTEKTGCSDTQFIVIDKYKDLEFSFSGHNGENICAFESKPTVTMDASTIEERITGLKYDFTVSDDDKNVKERQNGVTTFTVKQYNPELFDYNVSVVGTADKRCPATDEFAFGVYKEISKVEIFVNGKGQGKDTVRVCLSESSESSTRVHLTAKVTYEGDTLKHKDPVDPTYIWYMTKINADGSKEDTVRIAETKVPEYWYEAKENARAVYSVKVLDNVCTTDPNDAPMSGESAVVDIHKPIKLTITVPDGITKICSFNKEGVDNDTIRFEIKADNALDGNVLVTWYERIGDKVTEVKTTDKVPTSYTFTPKNTDKEMSKRWMIVKATDEVCDSNSGADSASYEVYVPVKIKLASDADTTKNGTLIKCIRDEEESGGKVHFWVLNHKNTPNDPDLQGDPDDYEWFKNGIHDPASDGKTDYFLKVEAGGNTVDVLAYDGVCNVKCPPEKEDKHCGGAGDPSGGLKIYAQRPLKIKIDKVSPRELCNGSEVEITAKISEVPEKDINGKDTDVSKFEISWSGDDVKDNSEVRGGKSNGIDVTTKFVGVNTADSKVTHSVRVETLDSVCANGNIFDTIQYHVFVPLEISLSSDAVNYKGRDQKCIKMNDEDSTLVDNYVFATVKKLKGDPRSYVWSDGLYQGLVSERQFVLHQGTNKLSVVAYDEVCGKSGASISNEAQGSIAVVAQLPITVELDYDRSKYCEGEVVNFKFNVLNSLDENIESLWSEKGELLYKNNGREVLQDHKVYNNSAKMDTMVMEVKVLDEICRDAEYVKTTKQYYRYKKIKFDLTSNVNVPGLGDQTCIGEKSEDNPSGVVTLKVTVTQGDPTKYVWSDGDGEDLTVRTVPVKVGTNVYKVTAYDDVCSKITEAAGYEGENESISIEAREPIQVSLAREQGRDQMCIGEMITLKYSVYNSLVEFDPNAKTDIKWTTETSDGVINTSALVNGQIANVSNNETSLFAPNDGKVGLTSFMLTASEIGTNVCPPQSVSIHVEAFNKASIDLITDNFAVCQDTSTVDSDQEKNKLITLTAVVTDGLPKSIYFIVGNNVPMIENGDSINANGEVVVPVDPVTKKAYLDVLPLESYKYKAFGSDDICRASFEKELSGEVTVSHKIYLTLETESEEVQMGDSSRFTVTTSLPFAGDYVWQMTQPEKKDLATTSEPKFSKSQKKDGEYTYRVSIDNGNCGVSKSNKVTIYVADYNIVPNVITPYNGNPKNDTFMKGYEVSIFDRYQQVIYEGTDGWDATYRGQTVTPGTYFYIVKKKDGRVLKGTVEVYK